MTNNSIYRPLDHFLQAEIISKLTASLRPLRFSEIKDKGIENSLFMYHANKLIDRGLIQKDEDGFKLTAKGARWSNYVDSSLDLTPITPRPLIQFIIEDGFGNVLMAKRKGSLQEHLNEYLLPGNVYRHGSPLEENAHQIIAEIFEESYEYEPKLITIADVIHAASDGFISHVICHIFSVITNSEKTSALDHPLFTTEWITKSSIAHDSLKYRQSEFIPSLFARLPSVTSHETFLINI